MMRVRYVGQSFGVDGLTNGKVYDVTAYESWNGLLRVIDDSEEDYLYSAVRPAPLDGSGPGGYWEVVEDDEAGTLARVIPPRTGKTE